jgi:transposase InsO family protein
MPFKELSIVSARLEFVQWALKEDCNMRELCRRFNISTKTGYKWLRRFSADGPAGLCDHSRKPHGSPRLSAPEMEEQILKVRDAHQAWGGRKIRAFLKNQSQTPPAASTITQILRRHGRLNEDEAQKHQPFQRFEAEAANDLWQMDFKGHFPTEQQRCHPLTVLDDHSRFAIVLQACVNERTETVQERLIQAFKRYGLPRRMLMDNGSPWGSEHTPLTVWLMRQSISVSHGRPYHPQTQGKEERFHRTLKAEVLNQAFKDIQHCQRSFDQWRSVYNCERPHEALKMNVPASRYEPSRRSYAENPPQLEYGPDDAVRRVCDGGEISFQGRSIRICKAFKGYDVALRPTLNDGEFTIWFGTHQIAIVNLREVDGSC